MRRFFYGNIRISPDFRFSAVIKSVPQCGEILRLPQRLFHLDTEPERAVLAPAIHHLAEKQAITLIDPHRRTRRDRFAEKEAQTTAGSIDRPPDDRIAGWVGQVSDPDIILDFNARLPPPFHNRAYR